MATAAVWMTDDAEFDEGPELSIHEGEPVEVEVKENELYKDVESLARHYIDRFFADKMMYCGGFIPKQLLHNPQRIMRVIDFNIIKGVHVAYKALRNTISEGERQEARRIGDTTSDVKLVNETLKLLARSSIPQQFAGGMMLMHLELVEGVELR